MSTVKRMMRRLALIILLVSIGGPVLAQQRRFVSGQGSDANPCSLSAPCRSFDAAIAAVDAGGEVVALDSAGYGPFTIDKAVNVTAPEGVYAGITVFSGTGITVQAGATDVVSLRGLTLTGLGGERGIDYVSGEALYVVASVIGGFSSVAILQESGDLVVKDTVIRGNSIGAFILGSAALFEHVVLVDNNLGLRAHASSQTSIRDCIATSNVAALDAFSFDGEAPELTIENCLVAYNSNAGVASLGGAGQAVVRVSNTMVRSNGTGLQTAGANQLLSLGNNTVVGNGTNGGFTGTVTRR